MITIQINPTLRNEPITVPEDLALVKQAARETLRSGAGTTRRDLTILLTGDEQVRRLNSQFLGEDATTDVLAFPAAHVDPDLGRAYLGDVVISYPRAQAQAVAGGHAVIDEVRLLVVHGVLHLLGFDHDNPQARSHMWALQAGVLERLGCQIALPSA
jgi:probable rRNA maturation factor